MAKFVETTVARTFEKRETAKNAWNGRIGHAELIMSAKGGELNVTLNGKVLAQSMIDYLMTYSLQSLQDSYAGAENLTEATASFEKRLDAIQSGTIGVRSGSGASEETIVKRMVAKAAFMASAKATDAEKEAFGKLSDDEQNAKLDGIFAKNSEKLSAAVEKKISERSVMREKRAEEKRATAALAGDLDI